MFIFSAASLFSSSSTMEWSFELRPTRYSLIFRSLCGKKRVWASAIHSRSNSYLLFSESAAESWPVERAEAAPAKAAGAALSWLSSLDEELL